MYTHTDTKSDSAQRYTPPGRSGCDIEPRRRCPSTSPPEKKRFRCRGTLLPLPSPAYKRPAGKKIKKEDKYGMEQHIIQGRVRACTKTKARKKTTATIAPPTTTITTTTTNGLAARTLKSHAAYAHPFHTGGRVSIYATWMMICWIDSSLYDLMLPDWELYIYSGCLPTIEHVFFPALGYGGTQVLHRPITTADEELYDLCSKTDQIDG